MRGAGGARDMGGVVDVALRAWAPAQRRVSSRRAARGGAIRAQSCGSGREGAERRSSVSACMALGCAGPHTTSRAGRSDCFIVGGKVTCATSALQHCAINNDDGRGQRQGGRRPGRQQQQHSCVRLPPGNTHHPPTHTYTHIHSHIQPHTYTHLHTPPIPAPSHTHTSTPMLTLALRTTEATRAEMSAARVPLAYRDSCAHLLIPLNRCRYDNYYLPWRCNVRPMPEKRGGKEGGGGL